MPAASLWGVTPRQSIEAACATRGRDDVLDGCVALLRGGNTDADLVASLAGPHAPRYLDAPDAQRYWLRTWGARGLLWAWEEPASKAAVEAVVVALGDDSWRVREMAAKVVARHLVDDALPALEPLQDDPVARVRVAAQRALQRLTGSARRP